jgi:hypothetical protein
MNNIANDSKKYCKWNSSFSAVSLAIHFGMANDASKDSMK